MNTCFNCGANLKTRKESISLGICQALIKFYFAVCRNRKNEAHPAHDCEFTKSEYANFQKLHYHRLVSNQACETGFYQLTALGTLFVRGEIEVPKYVEVARNCVQSKSEITVRITEVMKQGIFWLQDDLFLADIAA